MINKNPIPDPQKETLRNKYPLSKNLSFEYYLNASGLHQDEVNEECIITFPDYLEGNVVDYNSCEKAIIVSVQKEHGDRTYEKLWFPRTFIGTYHKRHANVLERKTVLEFYNITSGIVHTWLKLNLEKDNMDGTIAKLLGRKVRFSDKQTGLDDSRNTVNLFSISWADEREKLSRLDIPQLIQRFDSIASEIRDELSGLRDELSDFDTVRNEHQALWLERKAWEDKLNNLKTLIGN